MRVYVVYGSWQVGSRLMFSLSRLAHVEVVGQSMRADLPDPHLVIGTADVVLIDAQMPSGIDLLRTIKREAPGVVVIMMTEGASQQYYQRCLKGGAEYVFALPDEGSALCMAIECLAGNLVTGSPPGPPATAGPDSITTQGSLRATRGQ